jgi:DNA processing protein
MLEQGGLITEYLTETNPDKQNFVQRNRIIAGMCDAVLVVESAEKGGSLITCDLAQSYNRDVFAFPGRVGDEHSAGCNKLIKSNKAGLIENAADFLNAMCWESVDAQKLPAVQPSLFVDLTNEESSILDCLRKEDSLPLSQMALILGLTVSKVSATLLEMEFKGIVKCLPGNRYKLRV